MTTKTSLNETGQAAIIFLLAAIAVIVCLYVCYSGISNLAGTGNLFGSLIDGIGGVIK